MNTWAKSIIAVVLATLWISLSEFIRNEFLLKSYWQGHYSSLGLSFPSAPVNGAVWGIWSFCFAAVIIILIRKFSFWETLVLSWFIAFVLMWLVIGNMGVLPFGLLVYAIPLSIIETLGACWIIDRLRSTERK